MGIPERKRNNWVLPVPDYKISYIYIKIRYILEDDSEKEDWVLVMPFTEFFEAVNYAKKIFDKPMIRDFREENTYI